MQNARWEKKGLLYVCLYIVTRQMAVRWETLAKRLLFWWLSTLIYHLNRAFLCILIYIRTHHQLSTPILHTRETFFVFKTPQQQQLECTHADSRFQETRLRSRESEANFSKWKLHHLQVTVPRSKWGKNPWIQRFIMCLQKSHNINYKNQSAKKWREIINS